MGCEMSSLFWAALILLLIITVIIVVKLYLKLTSGWCRSNVCLVGKTAIITGGNTGIGYETAMDFAKRGAKVKLACRDPSRGQNAAHRIIKATGNKNVVFQQLDLASLKSVRDFAKRIIETEPRLDILVNNAGVGSADREKTEDGLVLMMQTNYLGHFLLTNLLLDLLKSTSNSRIVNVSSKAADFARNFDVYKLNEFPKPSILTIVGLDFPIYFKSKLCLILFTIELAKRLKGTGVTSYSLHPGVVLTGFTSKMVPILKSVVEETFKWFCKSDIEGAQTTIYCSVAKGIEHLSGEHFQDCHYLTRYKPAQDPDLPKKLWDVSEKLVHLYSE